MSPPLVIVFSMISSSKLRHEEISQIFAFLRDNEFVALSRSSPSLKSSANMKSR
ncbi:hypothetical protein B5X24_HaOG208184, partial [Helicoverpa armigera]